jgi:hypothetical protein
MNARSNFSYHSTIVHHARQGGKQWAATRAHPAQLDKLDRELRPHRSRLCGYLHERCTNFAPFVAPHLYILQTVCPVETRGDIPRLAREFWGEESLRNIEVDPKNPAYVAAFVRAALAQWMPYREAWDVVIYEEGLRAGQDWADEPENRGLRDRALSSFEKTASLLLILRESTNLARTLSWQLTLLRNEIELEEAAEPRPIHELPNDYLNLWLPPAGEKSGQRAVNLLKIENPRLHFGFLDGFLGLQPALEELDSIDRRPLVHSVDAMPT